MPHRFLFNDKYADIRTRAVPLSSRQNDIEFPNSEPSDPNAEPEKLDQNPNDHSFHSKANSLDDW